MCADRSRKKPGEIHLVRDLVAKLDWHQVPVVKTSTPIKELAESNAWDRHSRQFYVVDEDGRLMGNITLGRLVMYLFNNSCGMSIGPHSIMSLLTCEVACDLMSKVTLAARMEDDLDDLLERMVAQEVEEVPVVDNEERIVGDLTMIDIMRAIS